jgi:hypothetical protein
LGGFGIKIHYTQPYSSIFKFMPAFYIMPKEAENEKRRKAAGLFIPAGLFMGFAAGFIFGNLPAWMFGGLGVGFLIFALTNVLIK